MDWAAFQACLEDRLPGKPIVVGENAIDKCLEELTNDTQEATAASAVRRPPCANSRPPIPASIYEIGL
jgi:hypothetical protein